MLILAKHTYRSIHLKNIDYNPSRSSYNHQNTSVTVGKKVKWTTLVEGDLKAPFSMATRPRCRVGTLLHSLDCFTLPLILTLSSRVLSKVASSTLFESLIWLNQGLNSGLLGYWRTLYSLGQWLGRQKTLVKMIKWYWWWCDDKERKNVKMSKSSL